MIPSSQPAQEIRLPELLSVPIIVPRTPAANITMAQTTTMASMTARNVPQIGKPIEWTTLSRDRPKKKNFKSRYKWPGQLKNVEELKRRLIFIRQSGSSPKSPSKA